MNEGILNTKLIDKLKNIIQDCNINFLIGAGLSTPYLSLLGDIEQEITKIASQDEKEPTKTKEESLENIYKKLFLGAIEKNLNILSLTQDIDQEKLLKTTLKNYQDFLEIINRIVLLRRSTILSKQINLFTTNFDVLLEKSLDTSGVNYNDGFEGDFLLFLIHLALKKQY